MAKRRQDSFHELHDVPGAEVMQFHIGKAAALRSLGAVVYALRCGDLIKIGHTTNLARRCNKLGSDDVLAFTPGTLADEQAIHAKLIEHLAQGKEWYHPEPAVLAVVNTMRERLGLEPLAA